MRKKYKYRDDLLEPLCPILTLDYARIRDS